MHRDAMTHLEEWLESPIRKPLVLRGARQTGKSTLVRLFASQKNLELYEINLERHLYLNEIFKTRDMTRILAELQGLTGEIRNKENALLFLDEIQAVPEAIQCLRYFHEDYPSLAVIAAGSLLEFTLADHTFTMPVGRIIYYHLCPMSFAEYLKIRDPELHDFYNRYRWEKAMPQSRHEKLLLRQREYLFVGGMPEAVKVYTESESFEAVREVHRSIADTYIDDFGKYARKNELIRLQKVFQSIPLNLCKKIIYSNLSRDDRSADVRSALDLLCKARIITKVFHTHCSGIPLRADSDQNVFKLISLDCGLLNYQLGLSWPHILRLDERRLINEGCLAEQFAGQEFLAGYKGKINPELFYWLREGKSCNAEVDYIITHNTLIIPVEVKAGKSGSLKSLQQFVEQKKAAAAIRFDLNLPGVQQVSIGNASFKLFSLPLYLAGKLHSIMEEAF